MSRFWRTFPCWFSISRLERIELNFYRFCIVSESTIIRYFLGVGRPIGYEACSFERQRYNYWKKLKFMSKPRCGVPDFSMLITLTSENWNKSWYFLTASQEIIEMATKTFQVSYSYAALEFIYSFTNPYILIKMSSEIKDHYQHIRYQGGQKCIFSFGGLGGKLGHAFLPDSGIKLYLHKLAAASLLPELISTDHWGNGCEY